MRVIFAGHTGLEKDIILRNIVNHVYTKEGLLDDERKRNQFLSSFGLENILEEVVTQDSTVRLLEASNTGYAIEMWAVAFNKLLDKVESMDPDHAFLSMHLTFHVPGRFTIPYNINQITRFKPTHIITLIDDIFEVQARINQKNAQRGTDYYISLRDLARWRAQEIGLASWLTRNLPPSPVTRGDQPQKVEHYVVAVKHPVDMLRKLLFEPELPRVYASFPITSTRDSGESRKEIDEVRDRLHSIYSVFDPLTIDELSPWVFEQAEASEDVELTRDDPRCRWPLPETNLLCSGRSEIYPINLKKREVIEVKGQVEHSIRVRDFGLVDVCDYIIGYRPSYKGIYSKGMFAEFDHALNACRPQVPIHYYFPEEDTIDPGPFAQFRTRHSDIDEWWGAIEKLPVAR